MSVINKIDNHEREAAALAWLNQVIKSTTSITFIDSEGRMILVTGDISVSAEGNVLDVIEKAMQLEPLA